MGPSPRTILELSWPTDDEPPASIVVTFPSRETKRRRRRLEGDEFRTFSDRIPVRYIRCASVEEAKELSVVDAVPRACAAAITGDDDSVSSSSCIEDSDSGVALEFRLAEAKRRDLFDEIVKKLKGLVLRGTRIISDTYGRPLEVLEICAHEEKDAVSLEESTAEFCAHSGDKRKRRQETSPSIRSQIKNSCLRVYYAVDLGFQNSVQQETEQAGAGTERWKSRARQLVIAEYEDQRDELTPAFLDIPFEKFVQSNVHRGVRESLSAGLAVDASEGIYFDDFKDLHRDLDEDNGSIDYSDSNSCEIGLSSSDQLSYDAVEYDSEIW
eukprot:Gregarina_sp_Poly_1__10231@NODE_710_length_6658_cov_139_932484_g537_i0_p4_GENE_NODE_710_length_6658_cov_139_932484_g537_i0NODE_710_length_6658_cov_139_932484_g537_i0_p4_ORF_typecomplete_len326_score46_95tRNAsynt_2c/PF01411_19/0_0079_NODE_710_length_6658_cov_139_932484_g537_i034544431